MTIRSIVAKMCDVRDRRKEYVNPLETLLRLVTEAEEALAADGSELDMRRRLGEVLRTPGAPPVPYVVTMYAAPAPFGWDGTFTKATPGDETIVLATDGKVRSGAREEGE